MFTSCLNGAAIVLVSCLISAPTLAQPQYEYAVFKTESIGWGGDNAWGTNESGLVVGGSFLCETCAYHAYIWDGKKTIDLGTFGGLDSEAWDVNDAGTVVGWANNEAHFRRAFVWTSQTGMIDLGTFGGNGSRAFAVNKANLVVGQANFVGDQTGHAFVWDGTSMTDLGSLENSLSSVAHDINESGVVVGESWSDTFETNRPVMWKDDQIIDLGSLGDGTHPAEALALNDLEQVVGQSVDDDGRFQPYVWSQGQMFNFTKGHGYRGGSAWDINNNSEIVGSVGRGNTAFGFIWDQQRGLRILEDMLPPRVIARGLTATEITDSGIISAWGPLFDSKAFLFVPVNPELTLSAPVPGVVGRTNTWTITGAQPNAKIHFAYSLKGGGTVVPGCDKLDAVVQLSKPKVVKTVTADANGNATIQLFVPPAASGAGLILFQAVDQQNCEESQLTTFDFE